MSYVIFLSIGLITIIWGLKTQEEVVRLTAAIVGSIFLVWGLSLTPKAFLFIVEALAVIFVFRICVRCCECD